VYLEVRFPDGLPPLERTFYSVTGEDGRPLLTDAWGNEVEVSG